MKIFAPKTARSFAAYLAALPACWAIWLLCAKIAGLPRNADEPREAAVSWDAQKHSVSFAAAYTGCGMDTPLEFLIAAKGSEKDYESLFLSDANAGEIAAAFEKAGIKPGSPLDVAQCRVWPAGPSVAIDPPLEKLLAETSGAGFPEIIYTGGKRDAAGAPLAGAEQPFAVFCLYNMSQSLLQFDDSLDQSATYGRFRPGVKMKAGEKVLFTFALADAELCRKTTVDIEPGRAGDAIRRLRELAKDGKELDVLCGFSPEMTVKEAAETAAALAMLDSVQVKFNGTKEGQFYFRAYMPLEKWRDRKERLAQPPEVRFGEGGRIKVVEITEDWSDPDTLAPRLGEVAREYASVDEAAKAAVALAERTSTLLVFAPAGMKLARLYEFKRAAGDKVKSWYVFRE